MDNGISYDLIGQEQEEAYLWKDITMNRMILQKCCGMLIIMP